MLCDNHLCLLSLVYLYLIMEFNSYKLSWITAQDCAFCFGRDTSQQNPGLLWMNSHALMFSWPLLSSVNSSFPSEWSRKRTKIDAVLILEIKFSATKQIRVFSHLSCKEKFFLSWDRRESLTLLTEQAAHLCSETSSSQNIIRERKSACSIPARLTSQ